MKSPTPETIREARLAAGLSQTAAAELVHTTRRTWQQWEAPSTDTSNHRRMHPAMWELFTRKAAESRGTSANRGVHDMITLFEKFNEDKAKESLTPYSRPAIGGWYGGISRMTDGSVIVVLETDEETVIAVTDDIYADRAQRLERDPYNDAGYAKATIDLALAALANASAHQVSGSKQVRQGPWKRAAQIIEAESAKM